MSTPYKKFFQITLATFACLLFFECVVEFRQYSRGYDTLIFSPKNTTSVSAPTSGEYGPEPAFPFRSKVIGRTKTPGTLRIWVASASYAEASDIGVEESFANLICMHPSKKLTHCEALNGSKASWSVANNIDQLLSSGPDWRPDYVLLYQASNDIEYYSGAPAANQQKAKKLDNGILDALRNKLHSLVEHTSIYSHLRHFVGGSVLLSSQLADQLPPDAIADFRSRLQTFVDTSREIGATPIFATFVARNDESSAHDIPTDLKLQLLRYNGKLSPKGWLSSIEQLNDVIRQVGKDNHIVVLDLARRFDRKPEYYKDFFHFTREGHQALAKVIVDLLSEQSEELTVSKYGL